MSGIFRLNPECRRCVSHKECLQRHLPETQRTHSVHVLYDGSVFELDGCTTWRECVTAREDRDRDCLVAFPRLNQHMWFEVGFYFFLVRTTLSGQLQLSLEMEWGKSREMSHALYTITHLQYMSAYGHSKSSHVWEMRELFSSCSWTVTVFVWHHSESETLTASLKKLEWVDSIIDLLLHQTESLPPAIIWVIQLKTGGGDVRRQFP